MARRRHLLVLAAAAAAALSACGFQLRQAPDFAFDSLYFAAGGSPIAAELRRALAANDGLRVVTPPAAPQSAQVLLELSGEQREKVVVGRTSTGQVREFQLRMRVQFSLRTPQGRLLIPQTELLQQRDISFNESAVLAKEAEEALLYRDMQADIVQQLLRRLAAVDAV
ncbi:LPS-assembly lipoprotein LptE [Ramlibacter tataouinensis]|uniref:LPS-assembly lipoprotein LptE n=1 Tax=Ramlibacter tataouinensis (strain ATCC BAA-407 / DSM 14655 / LMG 21543 / TTB310) TaxID=365046 RepID=F5Y418_RAMTT|nr:LPS assembly lipoprotein LptE [Ramlibacter tataouinensis]AEG91296.1 Candidate Rare lipoprotein B [Ramlibacter tataouinensis TTB310]